MFNYKNKLNKKVSNKSLKLNFELEIEFEK